MPWTTPETFTAGQTLTAASMNAISGNLTEGYAASCQVSLTSDDSPYTINTDISWDSEDWDTDGMYPGSGTTLTVNTAGLYLVQFYAFVSATSSLTNVIRYVKIGSEAVQIAEDHSGPGTTNSLGTMSFVWPMAAAETVTFLISAAFTGTLTLNGSSTNWNERTRASLTWLGAYPA